MLETVLLNIKYTILLFILFINRDEGSIINIFLNKPLGYLGSAIIRS